MKIKRLAIIGFIALILGVAFFSAGSFVALAEEVESSAVLDEATVTEAWDDFKLWWDEWGGNIITFITSGTFATLVIAIVRGLVVRFISANKTANLTEKDKVDIAIRVVDSIVGKELNINPNDALNSQVKGEIAEVKEAILGLAGIVANQYKATGIMATGISRSKLLTEEEQEALSELATSLKEKNFESKKTIAKVEIQKKEIKDELTLV